MTDRVDPLDAAAQRIDERATVARTRAEAEDAASIQVPAADPEIEVMIASFLARVPPATATDLLHRWWELRFETYWPPRGMFGRRRKRLVPQDASTWKIEVVAQGWALEGYGRRVKVYSGDGEYGTQDRFVQHTVAVTTSGELLLAAVSGDRRVVVKGDASERQAIHPSPVLGPLVGAPNVTAALNRQFPELGPVVRYQVYKGSHEEFPRYDPMYDFRVDHLRNLAEAMVRRTRDAGAAQPRSTD